MLRQNHHRRSKLQERKAAEEFGGSTTPGSGNGWVRKGDVRSGSYLVECKTTTKESFSIKKQTWDKIANEALIDDRIPAMLVDISGRELIVLDKEDFFVLMGITKFDGS